MASSVIKKASTWESVTIGTNTYGTCTGYKNANLRMAFIRWNGNNNVPPSGGYAISFNLPSGFMPLGNSNAYMRNGDAMEVRTDGTVKFSITNYWSGGSIMYPTQS